MLLSPIHCCDVTKPPYLLSGELCSSSLHSNRLYVYNVSCRRGGQCFSVPRIRHTDVVGDSSGKSYITEQGHNVPLLRTRELAIKEMKNGKGTGVDGITIALLNCWDEGKKEILSLCNKIYKESEWPQEFTVMLILPIPKKCK